MNAFSELSSAEKCLALAHALGAVAGFLFSTGVLLRLIEEKNIPNQPLPGGSPYGIDPNRKNSAREYFGHS